MMKEEFGEHAKMVERRMRLRLRGVLLLMAVALWMAAVAQETARAAESCRKLVLDGEVSAGQEWKAAIGEGWVMRVLPIPSLSAGYTGWDLVVDRAQPAGFPDALLLATPPYNSINQREIGTTYGLRAQDVIGWNPRSFRFLTDVATFRLGQQQYLALFRGNASGAGSRPAEHPELARLMDLEKHAAAGELQILDARLAPGVADPAPFAQHWAIMAARTQHEIDTVEAGKSSARGRLQWMRFRIVLWLPSRWLLPPGVTAARAGCGQ
jgi:hypothetical protein